jgi:hypothetical protein
MNTIVERLVKYMEIKEITPYRMTIDAGLSVGLIGKSIKSNAGLNSETIEKILLTYQDLNAQWFVTGKGEILQEEDKIETPPQIVVDNEMILDMYKKVDYLYKLSLQNTAEQELIKLRNEIMKK